MFQYVTIERFLKGFFLVGFFWSDLNKQTNSCRWGEINLTVVSWPLLTLRSSSQGPRGVDKFVFTPGFLSCLVCSDVLWQGAGGTDSVWHRGGNQ